MTRWLDEAMQAFAEVDHDPLWHRRRLPGRWHPHDWQVGTDFSALGLPTGLCRACGQTRVFDATPDITSCTAAVTTPRSQR